MKSHSVWTPLQKSTNNTNNNSKMYWKHPVGQSGKALIQEKVISNAPPVHCTQDIGWVSLSNWLISFLACVRHIVSSFTKPWGSTCYIALLFFTVNSSPLKHCNLQQFTAQSFAICTQCHNNRSEQFVTILYVEQVQVKTQYGMGTIW